MALMSKKKPEEQKPKRTIKLNILWNKVTDEIANVPMRLIDSDVRFSARAFDEDIGLKYYLKIMSNRDDYEIREIEVAHTGG